MAIVDPFTQDVRGRTLDARQRHAAELAPAIHGLLQSAGCRPRDVCGIAVGLGPGSFTGLRVALGLVKGLAFGIGCDVAGFSSLDLLAAAAHPEALSVQVVIEAQRDAVYAASLTRPTPHQPLARIGPDRVLNQTDWLASLQPGDYVLGPPLIRRRREWPWPEAVVLAEPERCLPTLDALAQIARVAWRTGSRLDILTAEPHYLRPSAAEQKAAARIPTA